MKALFVDTSAFYALLVEEDENHGAARQCFRAVASQRRPLVSTSYAVHETLSLLQRRVGLESVLAWTESIQPLVEIVWVDAPLHARALKRLFLVGQRGVSLTDCTSFVCMEEMGLREAFAFDPDFSAQGFTTLPADSEPTSE